MRKILILYAKYGGGHYSAANSIRIELEKYQNVQVEMIDCIEYISKVLNKLTTSAYKEMAKKVPYLWGKVYSNSQKGVLGHISSRTNKVMAIKLKNLIKEKNPDLVVSTHPFSSQMVSYLRRKGKIDCKLVTVMTDFAPHEQWLVGHEYSDAFFVSNETMKKSLCEYGVDSNKIYVSGIPLSDRFFEKFDKDAIYQEFDLMKDKPVILFFGGVEFGLGKDRTVDILRSLIHNLPQCQIVAISGKNPKMNAAFLELVQNYHAQDRVKVYDYTNKVPELMSIASIVVSKPGGLTSSESLASGLPLLIINPIPGQEEENATFLEFHKVGVWIKKSDDPDAVIRSLFEHPEKLNEMKENTKLLAKKNSTKEICEIVLSLISIHCNQI